MDTNKLDFKIEDKIAELELNREMANDMITFAINNDISNSKGRFSYFIHDIREQLMKNERISKKEMVTLNDIKIYNGPFMGNEKKIYDLDKFITLYDAFNILDSLEESEFFSVKYRIGGFTSGKHEEDITLEEVMNTLNSTDPSLQKLNQYMIFMSIRLPNMTYTMSLTYSVMDDMLFTSKNVKDKSLKFVEPYNKNSDFLTYGNIISSPNCHMMKSMLDQFKQISESL